MLYYLRLMTSGDGLVRNWILASSIERNVWTWCQYDQHFTCSCFVWKLYVQTFGYFSVLTLCVGFFWQKEIGIKAARKMLVKLTDWWWQCEQHFTYSFLKTKFFWVPFLYLQFVFVFYWQMVSGKKVARKLLAN